MNPPEPAAPLYPGDSGELPLDSRRVLVQLLAGPALDGRRHNKLWTTLLQDETRIRRQLAELFLELIIDPDLQIAFTRQADTGEQDTPRLLRRLPLNYLDSVLLLYLRQRLTQAEAQGERAVVASDDIHEALAPYQRDASTDHAGHHKHTSAALEKMKKHNLLQKLPGGEERYEIAPALRLIFPAEQIQALTALYQQLQNHAAPDPIPAEDDEP